MIVKALKVAVSSSIALRMLCTLLFVAVAAFLSLDVIFSGHEKFEHLLSQVCFLQINVSVLGDSCPHFLKIGWFGVTDRAF